MAVYGCRCVGKTFLIKETLGRKLAFFHSGLAHRNKAAQLADKEVVGNLRRGVMSMQYRPPSRASGFWYNMRMEVKIDRLCRIGCIEAGVARKGVR